ncbi:F-box protein PP2-B15 [Cornus florida]|uniref:F-box protein PP2-B15 n=1 Tax=Cornus florida TaxID=4283 RepID=UPI0028A22756|nr:F-box protein PP2-B15 [Cornus florida]
MKLDQLPEDCMARVLSFTTPRDTCQTSAVSSALHAAADSDLLWEKFLPPNYREILSRLVTPVEFKSRRELFGILCSPLLIDGGNKSFSIDKSTSKKSYMLSARELSITWGSNPLYWCWKPLLQSRFAEVAELILIWWLEIHGNINTLMLSPNTKYGAYLILKICDRAHGLDSIPSEVSVEVGDYHSKGMICLKRPREDRIRPFVGGTRRIEVLRPSFSKEEEERVVRERRDGWLEIELGEFYNDGSEKEVKMSLREVKGEHLKGGIVVEGIEVRPKS